MTSTEAAALAYRDRYFWRPILFCREVLGIALWEGQKRICRAITRFKRVAVRSGHKIGKSTIAAALALWWVCTRGPMARVVMTSAGTRQVEEILWREVKRLHRGALIPIGGRLLESPGGGLTFASGAEIKGFTTDEPEKMAGTSSPDLFYIVDEGSGVPQAIFDAIEGNRAGGAVCLVLGNPTKLSGEFREAFTSKRHLYHGIHISSEETPNATGEGEPIPGLATKEWIEEKRIEWGEGSPIYAVRVKGEFPEQSAMGIYSLALLDEAVERWRAQPIPHPKEGRLVVAVDCARGGDDESVIQGRRGLGMWAPEAHAGQDGANLAGRVLEFIKRHRLPGERPRVLVDVIGLGASCFDFLNHQDEIDLELVAVNVAEASTAGLDEDTGVRKYAILRDQLWCEGVEWLKAGGRLPDDGRLVAELSAAVYSFKTGTQKKVASKDDMKKLIKRSPDRADAYTMAVYEAPSAASGILGAFIT